MMGEVLGGMVFGMAAAMLALSMGAGLAGGVAIYSLAGTSFLTGKLVTAARRA